jgi:peptide chain release factor 1
VFERLASLEDEFISLEVSLSDPDVQADHTALRRVSKRYKELTPVVECLRAHRERSADAQAARELLVDASETDKQMLRQELSEAEADLADLEEQLRLLMLPKDPNDGNLFAGDLYEMYRGFAALKGWNVEVLSLDASDLGGINLVTILINGDTAWSRLKFEGGTHRVQRVPATESQGRIHTSSATVMVLPEAEEVEVEIDERDLEIDVYRASGPGGQGVNTTDSAVRITHKPTGVVVAMQDERSQLQNRARAMQVLRARLLKLAQDEQEAAQSAERRSQVGGGGRGEKIRTYNYKENRVTDHRIGFTIYRLQEVLAGDLDDVVDALASDERARQLAGDE